MIFEIFGFDNGLTVAELKRLIADWPETDKDGNPTEVWVEDLKGLTNQVRSVWPLDKRVDGHGKKTADLLLSPDH